MRRRSTLALALALAAALALAPAAAAAAKGDAAAADRALDRALRGLVAAEGGPPGVIAVVQRGRQVRVHRAGFSDLGRRQRPRIKRAMRIASVAKAFSGAAALSLVQAGKLSLDTPIGALLPDLPAAWRPVTVGQALGHRGGLPDFSTSPAFARAVSKSPRKAPPPRQLLDFVADQPLEFPPGTAFKYSNTDNVVIGLIVEVVTGKPYARALRDLVHRRLGLSRTLLPAGPSLPGGYLHGYALGDGAPEDVSEEVAFGGWAWSSGGIVSAPVDLNRFVRGYVGGRLFGGAVRAAQRSWGRGHSEPPGPGRNSAGLALFRYVTPCGTVYGHTGSILGYTQLIAASANGRRSLTFTINTQVSEDILPRLRAAQLKAVCAAMA